MKARLLSVNPIPVQASLLVIEMPGALSKVFRLVTPEGAAPWDFLNVISKLPDFGGSSLIAFPKQVKNCLKKLLWSYFLVWYQALARACQLFSLNVMSADHNLCPHINSPPWTFLA